MVEILDKLLVKEVSHELIHLMNEPVPRYTSYPTAPNFTDFSSSDYERCFTNFSKKGTALSLYVHIPFCQSMCLYCGCSVILNRRSENEARYVDYLLKEIHLVARRLPERQRIAQIHFGGGTPTKLTENQIRLIMKRLHYYFDVEEDAELAMEVDPRTVMMDNGHKLRVLRELGFNRISFGVQDTDAQVQEAVKRRQSKEMTECTFLWARELGFNGINIDLIYGLPHQTRESFSKSIAEIIELKPDRIAMYSYARVPWLKPHQKAIKESTLPSTEEKFSIYNLARKQLLEAGYRALGMDHFALEHDELTKAYLEQSLHRNFMGYTVAKSEYLLGLGVTSIGYFNDAYVQNVKELDTYYEMLDRQELPVFRGLELSYDDQIRKWVIHKLMCQFTLNKLEFNNRFDQEFDKYFSEALKNLHFFVEKGLVVLEDNSITATAMGELFIRNIVSVFDAYMQSKKQKFSKGI